MCGGGKSKANQSTTSTAPSPEMMARYNSFLGRADAAASTPYQAYTGERVADFSPDQMAAFQSVRDNQGAARPYIGEAAGLARVGSSAITPDQIQGYMNPYTQSVVDATQRDFDVQNARGQSEVTGNAALRGALGGSRVGVAQALTAEGQARAQAPVMANLRSQGWGQALGAAQADRSAAGQGAYTMGNLGQLAQSTGYADTGAMLSTGGMQQQLNQSRLNVPYQNYQEARAYPFQTTGWLGGLYSGIGSQMGGTSTTTTPAPNPMNAILGLATGAAGAYLGAGGRFGFASGGAVMPYEGGFIPAIPMAPGRGLPPPPNAQKQQDSDPLSMGMNAYKMAQAFKGRGEKKPGDVALSGRATSIEPEMAAGGRVVDMMPVGGMWVPRGYAEGGKVANMRARAGTVYDELAPEGVDIGRLISGMGNYAAPFPHPSGFRSAPEHHGADDYSPSSSLMLTGNPLTGRDVGLHGRVRIPFADGGGVESDDYPRLMAFAPPYVGTHPDDEELPPVSRSAAPEMADARMSAPSLSDGPVPAPQSMAPAPQPVPGPVAVPAPIPYQPRPQVPVAAPQIMPQPPAANPFAGPSPEQSNPEQEPVSRFRTPAAQAPIPAPAPQRPPPQSIAEASSGKPREAKKEGFDWSKLAMPLIMGGAKMMSSSSPYLGIAAGEGIQAGVGTYAQQKQEAQANAFRQKQIDHAADQLKETARRAAEQLSETTRHNKATESHQSAALEQGRYTWGTTPEGKAVRLPTRGDEGPVEYEQKLAPRSASGASADPARVREANWLVAQGIAPDATTAYAMIRMGVNDAPSYQRAVAAERKRIDADVNAMSKPEAEKEALARRLVMERARDAPQRTATPPATAQPAAAPPYPPGVPTGTPDNPTLWNAARRQFKTPDGKIYDETGKLVQ